MSAQASHVAKLFKFDGWLLLLSIITNESKKISEEIVVANRITDDINELEEKSTLETIWK